MSKLKLACYYPEEEKPFFFNVYASPQDDVSDLKLAIQDRLQKPGFAIKEPEMLLQQLLLIPRRCETVLSNGFMESALGDDALVAELGFVTKPKVLNIIVADAGVLELLDTIGDPDYLFKRKVKKELHHFMDRLKVPSPAEAVSSSGHVKALLQRAEPIIHIGRPGCIPAVLFNTALAGLQTDLEKLDQNDVNAHDVGNACDYIRSATALYDDEMARQEALQPFFDVGMGTDGEWCVHRGRFIPDADWRHLPFPTMFLDIENTLGVGRDALLQAVVDYMHVLKSAKCKQFWEFSNFPVILVAATANRLEIGVAICIAKVYVTRLLVIDLSLGFTASALKVYYTNLEATRPPRLRFLFPEPTPVGSVTLLDIVYNNFMSRAGQPTSTILDLGETTPVMYTATLNSNINVVVKFTARYNPDAHRLLAAKGFAPKLYYCERVVGDLYMVVMVRVEGTSIWQMQQEGKPIHITVMEDIQEAVRLLHEADIVFGDLREPNILYAAAHGALLVDFDWAGRNEVGRYPASLNKANLWHEHVVAYGVMRKEHDLWQLDRLRSLCI